MNVLISEDDEKTSAAVTGEVDADNCADFGRELLEAPLTDGVLRVDVSGLSFIDSSGISELLRVRQLLEDRGQALELADPSPAVHRVLEITGLLGVFGLD